MSAVSDPVAIAQPSMSPAHRIRLYFLFFVVSGFCGLVYEVIWLRLAMASFGVTTALVSVVVSVFMAGLGLGCWIAGRLLYSSARWWNSPLRIYAVAELCVGLSSALVPLELKAGRLFFQHLSAFAAWQSSLYYLLVGAWIILSLLPWCTCMGSTVPLLMAVIRSDSETQSRRSFSFLYMANVLGALLGTLVSAFVLIELVGFARTLYVAGSLNLLLAISALSISCLRRPSEVVGAPVSDSLPSSAIPYALPGKIVLSMLFITGAVSMGLEVIWIRQFTPYLGNVVYAFAGILAVYLLATFVGSQDYRSWIHSHSLGESAGAWALLALFAVLPVLAADPLVPIRLGPVELGGLRLSAIVMFCALCGFLTPLLIDSWSSGDPTRAAKAYSINVVGSILGPLLAGFVLLPHLGERFSTFVLTVPLFAIAAVTCFGKLGSSSPGKQRIGPRSKFVLATTVAILIFFFSHDYETKFPVHRVRRDYTATVVAANTGWERALLVNGYGMTALTPDTKYMAHLPAAFLSHAPRQALVICFGMGTTFRSMLSWGVPTTAVDLVPSVPEMFSYYHADADVLRRSPLTRIAIDDGRRFLDGSSQMYDIIIVDPPPPPSAPGSSLLYSREFYEIVKRHLSPDGILQMWHPTVEGDPATATAVTRSLTDAFPYVRAFVSVEGYGVHYLASAQPIPLVSSQVLASHLPEKAAIDLTEWGPGHTAQEQFQKVLSREVEIHRFLELSPRTPAITDDEPINEYYLLRNWFHYYR